MNAKFLFKEKEVITELDVVELIQLEERGVKSLIGRLRRKVFTGLKLQGETLILSELKFIGLESL